MVCPGSRLSILVLGGALSLAARVEPAEPLWFEQNAGREASGAEPAAPPVRELPASERPASGQTSRFWNVRPIQRVGCELIAEGLERSPTLRHLMERLERSDVIVYVDVEQQIERGVKAMTRFMGAGRTHRFLRVTVKGHAPPVTMIVLLGHELQHALEVADSPAVRSPRDMLKYYQRKGVRLGDEYESDAAKAAARAIRSEMFGSHR